MTAIVLVCLENVGDHWRRKEMYEPKMHNSNLLFRIILNNK
jgi:hypothetical protein